MIEKISYSVYEQGEDRGAVFKSTDLENTGDKEGSGKGKSPKEKGFP